ncbi:MAG: O-antigen ligase family protein [Vulcanimicrobiaceae bacterium]
MATKRVGLRGGLGSSAEARPVPQLDLSSAVLFVCVGLTVGWLTLRRPAWGVAALVVLEPFALYRYVGLTTVTLPKIALAGAIVGLVLRGWPRADDLGPAARALAFAQAAVVAATALSIAVADFRLPAVRETFKAIEFLAFFLVVAILRHRDGDDQPVRDALVAVAALVSLVALTQVVTGSGSVLLVDGFAIPRIAGPIEGPNQLAGYLGLTLPLTLVLANDERRRIAYDLSALAQAVALVLTESRAGIATTAIAIALILVLRPQFRSRVAGIAAIGYAAGLALLGTISFAITQSFGALAHVFFGSTSQLPGAVGTRAELWRAAWTL